MAWLSSQAEKLTWEPADNIPASLIAEFENGTTSTVEVLTNSTYGLMNHTLIASSGNEQAPKKQKLDKNDWNRGYIAIDLNFMYIVLCRSFEENEQDIKLECNTEKDKAISHHRTAGIKLQEVTSNWFMFNNVNVPIYSACVQMFTEFGT